MSLPPSIHRLTRRFGIDLTQLRYEHSSWAERMKLIRALSPDVVVDVGANSGQYAFELRLAGYTGAILSVEPVLDAFQRLNARAKSDPRWTAIRCALGETAGIASINVAANSLSSSLLSMNKLHQEAAPGSGFVRKEEVSQQRLDGIPELKDFQRIFCKIDTQGFERQVLAGGGDLWPQIVAVQLETSHVPLYEDSWLHQDVMDFFTEMGWEPIFVDRGFTDSRTGRMLQSDWTFAPAGVLRDA